MDFLEMNRVAIEEFRANEGKCSGWLEGAPVVLVTMTGAKSGRELCSPLVYSRDGDDVAIIAARKWIKLVFPSASKCLCGNCDVS